MRLSFANMPSTFFDETDDHSNAENIALTLEELGDPLFNYWKRYLHETDQMSLTSQVNKVASLLSQYKLEVIDDLAIAQKAPNAQRAKHPQPSTKSASSTYNYHHDDDVDSKIHDHRLGFGITTSNGRGLITPQASTQRSNRLSLSDSNPEEDANEKIVIDDTSESEMSKRPATAPAQRHVSPAQADNDEVLPQQEGLKEITKADLFDAYDVDHHQAFLKVYRFKRLELHLASLLVKQAHKELLKGSTTEERPQKTNTEFSSFGSSSKHRNALHSPQGRPSTSPGKTSSPQSSDGGFTNLLKELVAVDELTVTKITLPPSLCDATLTPEGVQKPQRRPSVNSSQEHHLLPSSPNPTDPIAKQILESHLEIHAMSFLNYLRKLIRIDLLKTLTLLRRKQAEAEVAKAALTGGGKGAAAARINNTSVSSKLALQAAKLAVEIATELHCIHFLPELLLNQGAVQLSLKLYPDGLSSGINAHDLVTKIMGALQINLDDTTQTVARGSGSNNEEVLYADAVASFTSQPPDSLEGYFAWRRFLQCQNQETERSLREEGEHVFRDSFAERRQSTQTASPLTLKEREGFPSQTDRSRSNEVSPSKSTALSLSQGPLAAASAARLSYEVTIEPEEENNVSPLQYLMWMTQSTAATSSGVGGGSVLNNRALGNRLRVSKLVPITSVSSVVMSPLANELSWAGTTKSSATFEHSSSRDRSSKIPATQLYPSLALVLEEEKKFQAQNNEKPQVNAEGQPSCNTENTDRNSLTTTTKLSRAAQKESLRAWGGVLALVYRHIGMSMRFVDDFESAFRTLEVSHTTAVQFLSETDAIAILCKAAYEEAKSEFDQQNKIHHAPNVITKPRHYFDKRSPFPKSYLSSAIPQLPQKRRVARPEWNQSFVSGIPPSAAIAQQQRAEDAEAVDSYQKSKKLQSEDFMNNASNENNISKRASPGKRHYEEDVSSALVDQFRRSRAQIGIGTFSTSSPFAGSGTSGTYALSSPLSKGMMRRSQNSEAPRPSTAGTLLTRKSNPSTPLKGGRLPPLPQDAVAASSFSNETGHQSSMGDHTPTGETLTAADYSYLRQVYRLPWDPLQAFSSQTRYGSAANDATACWRDGSKHRPPTAVAKLHGTQQRN